MSPALETCVLHRKCIKGLAHGSHVAVAAASPGLRGFLLESTPRPARAAKPAAGASWLQSEFSLTLVGA